MRRFVVLLMLGGVLTAISAFACGPGSDKPPMQPDSEHPLVDEAGAPPPAT